jgi:hypothetical protein
VSTVDGLNAAWDAYMETLAAGDLTAQANAREVLYAAAQAHASVSRPLVSITRYYSVVNTDLAADPADVQDLAQELDAMRRATAVLAGAWPGTPPIVGG